jgi:hypothetical protein
MRGLSFGGEVGEGRKKRAFWRDGVCCMRECQVLLTR